MGACGEQNRRREQVIRGKRLRGKEIGPRDLEVWLGTKEGLSAEEEERHAPIGINVVVSGERLKTIQE